MGGEGEELGLIRRLLQEKLANGDLREAHSLMVALCGDGGDETHAAVALGIGRLVRFSDQKLVEMMEQAKQNGNTKLAEDSALLLALRQIGYFLAPTDRSAR